MTSLSRHLTVSLAASLLCFFLAQAVMVGMEMRKLSEDSVLSRLEDDMDGILAMLSTQPGKEATVDWEHVPNIFMRPFSGHYFQIQQGDQTIRSRSLWDAVLPAKQPGIERGVQGPTGQKLLMFSRSFVLHGRQLLLTVAEDTSSLDATSSYFQKRLLALSLAALLLLLAIQVWVIRRGLRPLAGLRQELRQLERGEVERLEQPVPAEIRPLVEEVNRLLAVLQQRLTRSRHAMGNLSHALKTPLTMIFQQLEKRPNDPDSANLLEQARRIEAQVNRELSRARMAGQSPGGSWLQAAQDIRDLAATLDAMYQQRVQVELCMEQMAALPVDREDMMELIGNLLDNACKWASDKVLFSMQQSPGLKIIVEDDGPGMSSEEQALVLGRGVRLDEAKQGHGLGLAIAREIVEAYDGHMELGHSEALGGLRVAICFDNIQAREL